MPEALPPTASPVPPHAAPLRVLYVADITDAPFRYRVAHGVEQLCAAGHWSAAAGPDDQALPRSIPDCDVLVLCRLAHSPHVEALLETAGRHHVPLVFDCDDLIFHEDALQHFHFLRDLGEQERVLYRNQARKLERTARACGTVLASTPAISAQAAAMGLRAVVHRNLLSSFQERQGRWLSRFRRWAPRAPLLGYFSGSNTHDHDLRSIAEPLIKTMERFPAAQLLVVGHLRVPEFAARFPGRVWVAPYLPWREYPALMARCRVLLAPLAAVSPFTDAKSALKFFEPGILGVPVIASPIAEMKAAIKDGHNGWLAESPQDWEDRLAAAMDEARARETGARAREAVRAGHTGSSQRGVLGTLLAGLLLERRERALKGTGGIGDSGNPPEAAQERKARRQRIYQYLFKPLPAWANAPALPAAAPVPGGVRSGPPGKVREDLASRYLRGDGIEVGALQNPLRVPPAARVRYVDVLTRDDARKHFPELNGENLVSPDIIDNGQTLGTIGDTSLDFCIQNHVLEHMRNPLGALRNWLRVLRPGGIAYVAVPDHSNKLDHRRPVTAMAHLLADDGGQRLVKQDHEHYLEWAVHINGREPGAHAEARAAELEALDYNIHFHVFDQALFREVLAAACREQRAEVCELVRNDEHGAIEHIAILRKLAVPEPQHAPAASALPRDSACQGACTCNNTPGALEYTPDPLGALRAWLRALEPGGGLRVSVPDGANAPCPARFPTTLEHLLLDAQDPDRPGAALTHYLNWAVRAERCAPGAAAELRAAELMAAGHAIRFHTFDEELLRAVLAEACRDGQAELAEFTRRDEQGAVELIAVLRRTAAAETLRRPVTMVMPVYNAYEKTVRSCETVLKHAVGEWALVVVDDASPDRRVAAYLAELAAREPRVRVLTNDVNGGFVVTANRGMRAAAADHDVLLLNSDIEATEGFLRRLQEAAYCTRDTGVVTPFSNNATICSVPAPNQDNELPAGFSVDEMHELVAASSLRRHHEVPTGVGFCMYIRREVLKDIGYFDEEAFGRGFGEENDFCERAKKASCRLRLCDSQFIFHAGKSSFGAEGHALSGKHAAILEARHPGYHAAVARFCVADPVRGTRHAINAHLRRWPHRADPAPLFLLHADPFRKDAGGTEAYVLDRVAHLGFKRALIAFPDGPRSILAAEIVDGDVGRPVCYRFLVQREIRRFTHDNPDVEDVLRWMTRLFGVTALCLDHLLPWPLNAVGRLGLPYLYVMHDFYAVCPSLNLLNLGTWRPCAVHFGGGGDSATCLKDYFDMQQVEPPCDFSVLAQRHKDIFGGILRNAGNVVFPSESSRKIVCDAYHLDSAHTVVIPHGYRQPESLPPRPRPEPQLKVALIGAVAYPIKGSDLVLDVMRRTRHLPFEWHLFGDADVLGFSGKVLLEGVRAVFHGPYDRGSIANLLVSAGADVALFTSVCPETFSFTLSEAFCAGVPPIVPRMGALSERVENAGVGWIVEPHSPAAIAAMLQALALEPSLIDEAREALRSFRHTSVEENAAAYRQLLEPLVKRVASVPSLPAHYLSLAAERAVL
jgi:GT2 family glycosyltransferase/glycosyltransferase involved in cell wall biosynthesis/SAM-dependent methyltransferase